MSITSCHEGARATGTLFRSITVPAPTLPTAQRVTAYLPPGYDRSDRPYSLAVFFDGQNMFDDEGSFRGGWQLHRLLDYRACRGLSVPIVAAIHTDNGLRNELLSPWSSDGRAAMGDRMIDWIADVLVPRVRSEVRVASGPENVLLGGSSLGGLMALYGFFRRPDALGRALAMSPSLGVGGAQRGPIFHYVNDAPRRGHKIYLDAGARECECSGIMQHTGELAELLSRKGYQRGSQLLFHADPVGTHSEASWKGRLPSALDFLCD